MVETRVRWLELMLKIADPVLIPLSRGELRRTLPVSRADREDYAHLEAFARTLTGMALWLESEPSSGEKQTADRYRGLARQCILNAVSPDSPDFMNFTRGYGQALVDAAFLAHAVLRAPRQLYKELPSEGRRSLAEAFKATRKFKPYECNWLLFSAMIETALFIMGEQYDFAPVARAADAFEKWYCGDGAYGDGEFFHFDYYNSFVIHPMYVDITRVWAEVNGEYAQLNKKVTQRAARYAAVLERMIAPDGTYPVLGRSVCYRFGAFHALAQAAAQQYLPPELPYAQVRCALDAVIKRTQENGMFDNSGYLRIGVCGSQPQLAEDYICEGSLYLCQTVFLPLGLSAAHPFWSGPDCDFTGKKIWSGADVPRDKAED